MTIANLAKSFGIIKSIGDLLMKCRLRWLGYVTRMPNTKIPNKCCLIESDLFIVQTTLEG